MTAPSHWLLYFGWSQALQRGDGHIMRVAEACQWRGATMGHLYVLRLAAMHRSAF